MIKEIKGSLLLSINKGRTRIEVEDEKGNVTFLEIHLDSIQFNELMAGHYVKCTLNLRGLEKVGKVHENKTFEFELPEELIGYNVDRNLIYQHALKVAPKGWEPDNYFGSQSSFFQKDGNNFARTVIRRWV